MVLLRVPDEWRRRDNLDDQIVEQRDRRRQRPEDVHEKNDPD